MSRHDDRVSEIKHNGPAVFKWMKPGPSTSWLPQPTVRDAAGNHEKKGLISTVRPDRSRQAIVLEATAAKAFMQLARNGAVTPSYIYYDSIVGRASIYMFESKNWRLVE